MYCPFLPRCSLGYGVPGVHAVHVAEPVYGLDSESRQEASVQTSAVGTLSGLHGFRCRWSRHTCTQENRFQINMWDRCYFASGNITIVSSGSAAAVGAILRVREGTPQLPRRAESGRRPPHGAEGGLGRALGLCPLPDHLHREEHPEERLLPQLRQGKPRRTLARSLLTSTYSPTASHVVTWSCLQGCFLWFLCHPVLVLTSVIFSKHQREKVCKRTQSTFQQSSTRLWLSLGFQGHYK